jgi:hypothetical protein
MDEIERIKGLTPENIPQRETKIPVRLPNGEFKKQGNKIVVSAQQVDYYLWWMDATMEGKLTTAYCSMQHGSTPKTMDEVEELFSNEINQGGLPEDLEGFVDEIDRLTESDLGNSSPPLEAGGTTHSQKKKTPKEKRAAKRRRKQNRGKTGHTESDSSARTTPESTRPPAKTTP